MNSFLINGYKIIKQPLPQTIIALRQVIARTIKPEHDYGVRNLHCQIPLIRELANSELIFRVLRQQTKQFNFRLIKAIYFNKNTNRNWSVPWHQDKTIAVKNKVVLPGFTNWTVKKGVIHVQPPPNVLAKITAIRIALDDTHIGNGGLKILPRTHNLGILNRAKIWQIVEQRSLLCPNMKAGDILVMHPLTIHSSNRSMDTNSRRIIHLEYTSGDLPQGLAWY